MLLRHHLSTYTEAIIRLPFRRKPVSPVNLSELVKYDPTTEYLRDYPTTERTFAFVDVSEFTNYTQKYGIHAAAQMLTKFRGAVRIVVGRHRVRVAKWLGDGVMLVGVHSQPVCEAVMELNELFCGDEFFIHSGICQGSVIIFEGDDYVGRTVNIASRLSDHARPSEICVYNLKSTNIPKTMKLEKLNDTVMIRGVGELEGVASLHYRRR